MTDEEGQDHQLYQEIFFSSNYHTQEMRCQNHRYGRKERERDKDREGKRERERDKSK